MPYKLYTNENIAKRHCSVEEAEEVFRASDDADKIRQFLLNLEKLRLVRNGVFDIMEYARYYCEKDTKVLRLGYEKFRTWMLDAMKIDIDHQVTSSGVARAYLQNEGCFEGVENLGGITREFHKQFVVGGRVMTRENKKVHAGHTSTVDEHKEGSLSYITDRKECERKKTERAMYAISDYDAVSLYPSAMARMPGFLKGKPKVLQPEQLNKKFLDSVDGYFVHIRIKHVGIRRAFPLLTEMAEDGTRRFSNDIKETYVDKTGLEDLIEFQKVQFEILDGTYFDEGRNDTICNVMRRLFKLRQERKAVGNKIQEVYKLIMNSGYGFTIMKAPEYDLQIKSSDEADTYIARNYGAIHSITELSAHKIAVKVHKTIDDHYVPLHAGIEVLSWSKRIMNEVMCLAEDIGIPIFYQDTDSMHLPEADVPRLEAAFKEKYGRELRTKEENLGEFHPDFEIKDKNGDKDKGYKNIRSIEGIFVGKKCYLDILEGEKDGKIERHLHVRMKGVPTPCVKWTAKQLRPWLDEIKAVKELYLDLLDGRSVEFDLTQKGTRAKFDSARNFTVRSRDKFDRKLTFKTADVLRYDEEEEKPWVDSRPAKKTRASRRRAKPSEDQLYLTEFFLPRV